jgi:hypothetical protein
MCHLQSHPAKYTAAPTDLVATATVFAPADIQCRVIPAGASGGSNLERILSLERRMDTMERWKLEDDDWKAEAWEYLWQLEERLKRAGM